MRPRDQRTIPLLLREGRREEKTRIRVKKKVRHFTSDFLAPSLACTVHVHVHMYVLFFICRVSLPQSSYPTASAERQQYTQYLQIHNSHVLSLTVIILYYTRTCTCMYMYRYCTQYMCVNMHIKEVETLVTTSAESLRVLKNQDPTGD